MNAKLPAKQLFHALSLVLITILLLSSTGQNVEARPLHLEFDCSQQTEIPEAECNALVALYNSTDGANWDDNTDWLQTNTPCSWHGVGCDNGNIVSISLYVNNLMGSIPSELGNLANLSTLGLSSNKLSGTIPPELGNLTNLQSLWLSHNQLSGTIPFELGNLTNLRHSDLTSNQFSGEFPNSIINLKKLIYFRFDTCEGLTASDPNVIRFLDEVTNSGWSDCPKEFVIEGKNQWIRNGSTTVYGYNGTDFGNVVINSSRSKDYRIYNQSSNTLSLSGTPKVEIIGSSAFSVISLPKTNVSGYNSTSFSILFDPQSAGVHTATVSIANNSANKNPYTFTVQGIAIWADAYEEDNEFSTAKIIAPAESQTHALYPSSHDKDYVKFTLTRPSGITLETTGEWGYDTEIALYDENYNLIGYDNDGGEFLYSKLTRTCDANPLPAGTYYAMVYNYEGVVPQYQLHFNTEDCPIQIHSTAAQDGWILESSETSNKGGSLNTKSTTINIGDDAANKQYRVVLSFNTALPEGAVITKATLKFKYAGKTGTLPFSTHGKLLVDVKKGAYSNNPALQLGDFNASANKNGLFSLGKSTGWFTKIFSAGQLTYINTSGVTQFRLRFAKDDNNDLGADFLKIYSGNAGSNAPQLIIEYTLP